MTDRPILFSGPMVRALLDGRKTMTRRLAWRKKPDPADDRLTVTVATPWQRCKPSDRLWVRETWAVPPALDDCKPRDIWPPGKMPHGGVVAIPVYVEGYPSWQPWPGTRWRPSIHMPRWASRITLVVTATKIERLQDISEDEAKDEGAMFHDGHGIGHSGWRHDYKDVHVNARSSFACLWNSLHGENAWDTNPEVVALSFTVHKTNIDAMDDTA